MKPPINNSRQNIQNTPAKLYSDGMAIYQQGRYAEAEKIFARILIAIPNHADVWHMRGVCCLSMVRLDEAETFIRKAVAIRKDAAFYTNLGITLAQLKKTDPAIAAYRESLALNPNNAQTCSNLGNLLKDKGELEEAETLYRQAIKLAPHYAHALSNLGVLLMETERAAEAAAFFQAAGDWGRLTENLRTRAAWDTLAETEAACIDGLKRGGGHAVQPWPLLNIPALTPQLERKAALRFASAEYADALQRPPLVNTAARNGPLRIGYLSADFYGHATMLLLAGVLEAHDPARFDIHLLSINARPVKDSDGFAKRMAAMPAAFHDLSPASDTEAAQRIAGIAPHLLIDLKGYTADNRLGITALRPAPVIVSWLGYPGTLGHERLADYIIGDPVVTPPGHAGNFSETLALMPHCYQPNDRLRPLSAPASRAEEGLPERGLVFCSFNQFIKISPATFDIWCRLLAAAPGSVLWLLGGDKHPEGEVNLRREAGRRGIPGSRLVFAERQPLAKHLARLRLADLALDTFPCNSHTTASDALWAGVPLVTRIGQTFASRVAASLLTTHGCPELIAPDDDAYFALALSLVNQPARLRQIRQKLDAARLSSPLFDTVRFTRDLERLYEAIWQQHRMPRGERPPLILQDGH